MLGTLLQVRREEQRLVRVRVEVRARVKVGVRVRVSSRSDEKRQRLYEGGSKLEEVRST